MKNIFNLLTVVWILMFPLSCAFGQGDSEAFHVPAVLQETWGALLEKHVGHDGIVDYKGFIEDKPALEGYLDQMGQNPPGGDTARNETLAYYINLYNAATVMLILENYPLQSIRDIDKPWERKWIKVGEATLSLDQIEHEILRKMGDPRIHFAINCASLSCPRLWNKPYNAKELDKQLDQAALDFINDPSHNVISADSAKLSRIFEWYYEDFTAGGTLAGYINRYSRTQLRPGAIITYQAYDWGLNEQH